MKASNICKCLAQQLSPPDSRNSKDTQCAEINRPRNSKDTQCAEINRQEIGGESPLPGKENNKDGENNKDTHGENNKDTHSKR
jgi:hypothetical protein